MIHAIAPQDAMRHSVKPLISAFSLSILLLAGCDRSSGRQDASDSAASVAEAGLAEAETTPTDIDPAVLAKAPGAFIDRVWRVERSSTAVEAGTLYTFQADGTLVVQTLQDAPTTSRWAYEEGALTMFDEGIPYPTDIVALEADRLVLRSNNPGPAVTIALVPADGATVPEARR